MIYVHGILIYLLRGLRIVLSAKKIICYLILSSLGLLATVWMFMCVTTMQEKEVEYDTSARFVQPLEKCHLTYFLNDDKEVEHWGYSKRQEVRWGYKTDVQVAASNGNGFVPYTRFYNDDWLLPQKEHTKDAKFDFSNSEGLISCRTVMIKKRHNVFLYTLNRKLHDTETYVNSDSIWHTVQRKAHPDFDTLTTVYDLYLAQLDHPTHIRRGGEEGISTTNGFNALFLTGRDISKCKYRIKVNLRECGNLHPVDSALCCTFTYSTGDAPVTLGAIYPEPSSVKWNGFSVDLYNRRDWNNIDTEIEFLATFPEMEGIQNARITIISFFITLFITLILQNLKNLALHIYRHVRRKKTTVG